MICRRTMSECQTAIMCAPYGGCAEEKPISDNVAQLPRRDLIAEMTGPTRFGT